MKTKSRPYYGPRTVATRTAFAAVTEKPEPGSNIPGRPFFSDGGCWHRRDTAITADGSEITELRFCSGKDDHSPVYRHWEPANYDSRCSSCYLGFSHTVDAHQGELREYEPGTCPRCRIGSKRECCCTFGGAMNRTVKSLKTGEVFIETGLKLWAARLSAWRADHSKPCPMPQGHLMFRKPGECGCVRVEGGQL